MVTFRINFERFFNLAALSFAMLFFFAAQAVAAPAASKIDFWDDSEPRSVLKANHSAWQEILETYVDDQHPSGINRFDYKAVSSGDVRKLDDYINYLQQLEPRQFNSIEAKAYWINMFNALLIDMLIEGVQKNAISSVRSLGNGIWKRKIAKICIQDISLDNIEHGILRPIWKDPRIHYALTSGALGGGNLQKQAYTADNVEQLLAKSESEFLNSERGVRVEGKKAVTSSVFDWYRKDFVEKKADLLPYLKERVSEDKRNLLAAAKKVKFQYNWKLNSPEF